MLTKTGWILLIAMAFGLASTKAKPQLDPFTRFISRASRSGVPLPQPPSIATAPIEELPTRAKREGFVDLGNFSNMMRGFAKNLGRGINTMVQQGHNLGHRMVHSVMHNMPDIVYGNWKPITNTKPIYPSREPSYKPPPPQPNYKPQPISYPPATPSYSHPTPTYTPPFKPIYNTPDPIIVKPKPIYKEPNEPTFVRPEPIYIKPEPKPTYAPAPEPAYSPVPTSYSPSPSPTPSYSPPPTPSYSPPPSPSYSPSPSLPSTIPTISYEPFPEEPEDDSYGTPIGQPIETVVQPFDEGNNALDGFISHAAVPEPHIPIVSTTARPILITTEHPKGQIVISHIPEEYSQNPDHIDHIAGDTLFYKDLGKLKEKLKMVDGKLVHHKDKLGPSLKLLRS